jgi:hypothetical protein
LVLMAILVQVVLEKKSSKYYHEKNTFQLNVDK